MNKFIFISGGAKSGKSRHAVRLAKQLSGRTVFVATAEALDEEMKERIQKHKAARPADWDVIEESRDIHLILPQASAGYDTAIIDCMGLLISNLMADGMDDSGIEGRIRSVITEIRKSSINIILVSNEAGMGIVPENAAARRFRDLLGSANQQSVEAADEAILMFSGIPIPLKGGNSHAKINTDPVKN